MNFFAVGTASVARGWTAYLDSLFSGQIARHLNETLPMHIPFLSPYPDFLALAITLALTGNATYRNLLGKRPW